MSSSGSDMNKNFPEAAIAFGSDIFYLHKDVNEIGRSMTGLIPFTQPQVSRKHCTIEKTADNKYIIRDSSVYGTIVNRIMLKNGQVRELKHKDKIWLVKKNNTPMIFLLNPSLHKINEHMSENMLNLSNSQQDEMEKLDQEINKIETTKSGLKKGLNAKLEAHENMAVQKKQSVSSDATLTKEEVDKTLKEIEEKNRIEREKLTKEVEMKMKDITKKEEELQQMKEDMEKRHEEERKKLEMKWQNELEDMKEKLAKCEEEKSALDGKTRQVEEKLVATKMILLESELEQHRIFQEKVGVETELGSKIIDLTKESTRQDEVIKDLELKLKEKEETEQKMKKGIADLEEELQCSICAEVFFEPTILNCGHMFCKSCINEWKMKKKTCPVCRAKIKNCIRMCNMDSIIDKCVASGSADAKERRQELLERQSEGPSSKRLRRYVVNAPETLPPQPQIMNLQVTGTLPLFMHVNNQPQGHEINMTFGEEPDVFMWEHPGERVRIPTPRPMDTVEVAAIDLTNVPATSQTAPMNRTYNGAPTAMIDLTTP